MTSTPLPGPYTCSPPCHSVRARIRGVCLAQWLLVDEDGTRQVGQQSAAVKTGLLQRTPLHALKLTIIQANLNEAGGTQGDEDVDNVG